MEKINLITSPDKLFNDSYSILLIHPSDVIKNSLQNIIAEWDRHLNVYLYENTDEQEAVKWLIDICQAVDVIIYDLDNSTPLIRDLSGYIINNPKTYWLTNAENSVYNNISVNKVYNLDFLTRIKGGTFEKQQQKVQQTTSSE